MVKLIITVEIDVKVLEAKNGKMLVQQTITSAMGSQGVLDDGALRAEARQQWCNYNDISIQRQR